MPTYVPPPFYSPAQIVNDLGTVVAELYTALEARVNARIAALLSEGIPAPDDLIARQRMLHQLQATAAEALRSIDTAMAEDIVRIAAEAGSQAALRQLGLLPVAFDPASLLQAHGALAVSALALDLSNRLAALEQRILRYPQDAYQRIVAWGASDVLAGTTTSLRAQQRAVARFLSDGITGFVDVSGRNWTVGTYSEMATRTAVLRAWSDATVGTMQEAGINLVSPVIGNTACDKCGAWAGKVLSTDGTPAGTYEMPHATDDVMVTVTVAATLDDARAQGFQHPNCRCALVAYLPGLRILQGSTYSAEREAELVRTRELERKVRAAKRAAAAGDEDGAARLKQARKELREHTKQTGLHRQSYREQLWFTDGHGARHEAGPAVTYRPGARPTPAERATFDRLQGYGHTVTVQGTHSGAHGFNAKSPDLYMDGALWEVKTITSGNSNKLTGRMAEAARQSSRIVIDMTDSSIPFGQALRRLAHDAERYGVGEVLMLMHDREYRLHSGQWSRRR